MRSRGGETGGLTIMDALALYEERGYGTQFGTRQGGNVKCFACGELRSSSEFEMHSMRRVEGVSDPADEALIAALVCPACEAHGTLTMMYGPMAPPEDNEALRLMKDAREAIRSGTWHAEHWLEERRPEARAGEVTGMGGEGADGQGRR